MDVIFLGQIVLPKVVQPKDNAYQWLSASLGGSVHIFCGQAGPNQAKTQQTQALLSLLNFQAPPPRASKVVPPVGLLVVLPDLSDAYKEGTRWGQMPGKRKTPLCCKGFKCQR